MTQAEEYLQQQQTGDVVTTSPRPPARPMPTTPPPNASTPATTQAQQYLEQKNTSAPPPVQENAPAQAEQPDRGLFNRTLRRGGADLIGAVPSLLAIPTAGRALFDRWVSGTAGSFNEGMMTEEGRKDFRLLNDPNVSDAEKAVVGQRFAERGNDNLRFGARVAMDTYEWAEGVADALRNEDGSIPLDETVGSIGLTSALTLPLLPARGVALAGQTASKSAMAASKIGSALTRAAEVTTPFTIVEKGASVKRIAGLQATNAAVGLGIDTVMREANNENSIYKAMTGQDLDVDAEGLPGYATEAAVVGGAITGAALIGLRPGRASSALKRINELPGGRPVKQLGPVEARNPVQWVNDYVGHLTDDKQIVRSAVERTTDTVTADDVDATIRATTGNAMPGVITRAYDFGDYGFGVKGVPVNAFDDAYKQLGKQDNGIDRQMLFMQGYEAADELSRRARSKGQIRNEIGTTSELLLRKKRAQADPEVKALMDRYSDMMQAGLKVARNSGIIDEEVFKELSARKYYMHNVQFDDGGTIWDKIMNTTRGRPFMSASRDVAGPDAFKKAQAGGMTKKVQAPEVGHDYIRSILTHANNNASRTKVVDTLSGKVQRGGKNLIVQKKAKGQEGAGQHEVSIYRNGKRETYMVGDSRIANALMFRPRMVVPGVNTMRRFFQSGTTGAFNPSFAPISAIFDAGAMMLGVRNQHSVSGHFDQVLRAMGMPVIARQALAGITRPAELPANFVEGLWHGVSGRWKHATARQAQIIAERTGHEFDIDRADELMERFYRSRYGQMMRSGGAHSTLGEDFTEATGAVERLVQSATDTSGIRGYMGMLESVRDAFRMANFSRNFASETNRAGRPLSREEINRIARHTRESGSDIGKQSGSQLTNAFLSAVPYGNTILQSTTHLVKHMLSNPAAWSVGAAVGGYRYLLESMQTDEAREWIDANMPDYRRTPNIVVQIGGREPGTFDPDKHLELVPLSPELGFVSMLTAGIMDNIINTERPELVTDRSLWERAMSSSADLVGFGVDFVPSLITTTLGMGRIDFSAAMQGRELLRQPREDSGIDDFRGHGLTGGYMTDYMADVLNTSFGTAGRLLADMGEAALDQPSSAPDGTAWDAAMDVVMHNFVKGQQVGQWLTDAAKPQPRSTPLANKVYEMDRGLEQAAAFSRALVPGSESTNDADLFGGQSFQIMAMNMNDRGLAMQAYILHQYLNNDVHSHDMESIGQLKIRQHRVRGDKEGTLQQRNTALNDLNEEISQRMTRVMTNWDEVEQRMIDISGDEDWSLDKFLRRAREDVLNGGD